ncbi:MAG TPA: DinB family protein [Chitinophagales bacterium]|nr:DinB family protein [Chitinophagales bacterium]
MKNLSEQLLQNLIEQTRSHLNYAISLQDVNEDALNHRLLQDSWSILECIEHLNLYGNYYLPEIEKQLTTFKAISDKKFKSGWLGNYFAESMLPKEQLNKMKTFKSMNPIHSQLSKQVLNTFIEQQQKMLQLLSLAHDKNLNNIRIPISINKWIKIKLGDTFRFVIYHNERHIQQAKRLLEQTNSKTERLLVN